jgi:single-strand DNA-binding protein
MSTAPITIIGNATADPDILVAQNGNCKVSFGVAVDRNWKDPKSDEWKTETSFFNVIAWDPLAGEAGRVLTKGMRVLVHGRLVQRSYEKDGEKRSVVEIVADDIAISVKAIESMERKVRAANGSTSDQGGSRAASQPAPKAKVPSPGDEPF